MATNTLVNLTAVISANNTKFKSGINGAKKELGVFQKAVNSIGPAIAGAFAVGAIARFGKEAFMAAAGAQGIEREFNALNKPQLLGNLRDAVKGTVSDVRLMQAAVKANNFKIPLEQLAGFFEFAQKRATETGESVDYLVESITNGIARKSLPILDNLGLSATEVREEFNKTGDMAAAVGNIIERSMGNAGVQVLTTKEKVDQLNTSFENLKIAIGKKLAGGEGGYGIINVAAEDLQKISEWLNPVDKNLQKAQESADGFLTSISDESDKIPKIESRLDSLNRQLEYSRDWYKRHAKAVEDTRGREKKANEERQEQSKNNIYVLSNEIKILKDYIKTLNEIPTEQVILPEIKSPNSFSLTGNEWKDIWLDLGLHSEIFAEEETQIMKDLNAEISAQFKELSHNTSTDVMYMRDVVKSGFKDIEDYGIRISEVITYAISDWAVAAGAAMKANETLGDSFQRLGAAIVGVIGQLLVVAGLKAIELGNVPAGLGLIGLGLGFNLVSGFMGANKKEAEYVPYKLSGGGSSSSTLHGNDILTSNNYNVDLYNRVG